MTYLLDTSALLAHFLNEEGAGRVSEILGQGPAEVAVASPTVVELLTRLEALMDDHREARRVHDQYIGEFCSVLPVDLPAAREALSLRQASVERLPLVDALIAGCAKSRGLALVHRDRHLASIPRKSLKAVDLAIRSV